jgi:hypothetical protein
MATTNLNSVFNGSLPNLVITEIIHSPNDIEMIEIYNAGATAVNLGGLKWTDGTTGNFPEVSLAAGATGCFCYGPFNRCNNFECIARLYYSKWLRVQQAIYSLYVTL